MTRPATTASPSPQLASIMRSSAPVIGFSREHHPGHVGIEQRLDDDADARAGEQADPLAVGDGRVGVGRPPDLPATPRSPRLTDGTLSRVRCWPAKLASAPSSSTADERTASGACRGRDRLGDLWRWPAPPRGDGLDDRTRRGRRRAGRGGRPARRRPARPPSSRRPPCSRALARGTTSFTRARLLRPRLRRPGPASRRRCARSPRASRRRRGCRTHGPRWPSGRAGRRCRSRWPRAAARGC